MLTIVYSKRKNDSMDVKKDTSEDETFAEIMQKIQKVFAKSWESNSYRKRIEWRNLYIGDELKCTT